MPTPVRAGSRLSLAHRLGALLAVVLTGCGSGSAGSAPDGQGGAAVTARMELEVRDLSLSVDDAGSAAESGAALTYAWSFGDGAVASGRTPPPHLFAAPGTYTVTLTVADGTGATGEASRAVSVAQRTPGDYAPGDATTGVPEVVADRLYLVDLELAGKSATHTPTVDEETLLVTMSGGAYLLYRNKTVAVSLPAEHAYLEDGRLVLDRLHLRGYLEVRAPDVTVRRSVIEGVRIPDAPVGAAPAGVNTGRRIVRGNNAATTGLRLEDLELRVAPENQRGTGVNASYHHGLGLEASRLTLLRSEIVGTVDGMQVHQGGGTYTEVLIERSWVHGMQFHAIDADRTDGDPTHSDAIQVECSLPAPGALLGVRLLGNTLDVSNDPNLNAALMVTKNACATAGLLVQGNYLDGAVFAVNVGSGLSDRHITLYANDNRFGPNRATGTTPNKTWTPSFTAKVIAAKANTDGGASYENYDPARTQGYVYFSFDPPAAVGAAPPAGEANRNVMVDHAAGSEAWGAASRGAAGVGLY